MGARTFFVAGLTLLSRLVGLAREVISASLFGHNSGIYDAFITAWRIPNLFRKLLGEGALSVALQEGITKADNEDGLAAGAELFQATARFIFAVLLVLCGACMVIAWCLPDTMPFTGAEWLGSDPGAIRELVVRLMPYVVLVCMTALACGALNVRGRFATSSWSPILFNVGWVAALVVVGMTWGWEIEGERPPEQEMAMVRALGWGVLGAGFLQFAMQIPALKSSGFLLKSDTNSVRRGRVKRVLRDAIPLAVGAAVYQLNVLIDGWMAEGMLPDGGPTLYYYANRLQQLPMALISISAATAAFPVLLAQGQRRDLKGMRELHDRTQRGVIYLLLPAAVGLFTLAGPHISALLAHGEFGSEGVVRATPALQYLTLALIPAGAALMATRVYISVGDKRTPVVYSIVSLALNTGLNVLFLGGLDMDIEGLALGTAISSWVHLFLLLQGHRKLGLPKAVPGTPSLIGKILVASLIMGLAAHFVDAALVEMWGEIAALCAAILVGAAAYFALAELLKIPIQREFLKRLLGRFKS
ncbi:MAG: murein biosynthesis integral membrane protein MurJ [Planctomycetota bacterium]|nr:murein biosynthesis integral membrane protein MurJ [Planctomycetota bacterium]